jgi:hypothetical protein
MGQSRRGQQAPASTNNLMTKTREARIVLGQAKAAAAKIKSDLQRKQVLDDIGEAQAKAGDLEEAVDTANQAMPFESATLDAIGEQLAATNDLARAKSLGLKLKKGGGASTIFSCMARTQAKEGNIDGALLAAQQIQFLEVRSYAFEEIAQHQAARGDYPGARKTFALARAAHQKGLIDADDVEMMIVMSQLSGGDRETARKTIDSWKPVENRFAGMIAGAAGLLQQGDKTGAAVWLEDALEKLPAGQNYDFLRYIAVPLQVKLGQTERAMQAAAAALSADLRMKGYNAVAVACAETKDISCVNMALEKMYLAASAGGDDKKLSKFGVKLMTLNVTAALIDNGQFEPAARWLKAVEQDRDDLSAITIELHVRLQRAFVLAQHGRFEEARSMALKIRAGSVDEAERGTALRITALLQTRNNGVAPTRTWASTLADNNDRAYSLLGLAQALLQIDKVKLGYSAIQVH